ncbi:MAG: Spy/CpxP family protein refolding chaperone [Parvibaculaceae bacterium]
MRKLILTSAVILSAALGASSFALADKAASGDHGDRHANMCADRSAREIGHLAFLEAKLKPTAAQDAAWKSYKGIMTSQATASEKSCTDRVAAWKSNEKGKRPTIVERQAMMTKGLEAKVEDMKASQPALTKLYASLNDEQKQVLDRDSFRRGDDHKGRSEHHGDKRGHKGNANAGNTGNDMSAPAPEAPAAQ